MPQAPTPPPAAGVPEPPTASAPPPPPPPPPPAQPGGYGAPAGAGYGAPTGTSADVGSAFSWAFNAFGKDWGTWVGLAFIVAVIQVLGIVSQIVVDSGLLSALLQIFFGILSIMASVGLYRAALRRTQGVKPSFDALTTGENLGAFIITAIVVGLLVYVGFLLLFLPGLAAIFFLQFAAFRSLDTGESVGAAIPGSARMVLAAPVAALLLLLINAAASFLGVLLCFVGALFLVPIAILITVHVYRQLRGEPIAP
jgi:uncharacterized membrane protein